MLRGGSPREYPFADQALPHVFPNSSEYLADLVGADGACASLSLFVSSHVDQQ
jgi:hypothetical protein